MGTRQEYRRRSLASYSRSMQENPLRVGVETRNTFRRQLKVRVRASASATG
jgi:hypothetical protein